MKQYFSKFALILAISILFLITMIYSDTNCAKFQERCSAFKKCCPELTCQPFAQKCYHNPRLYGEPCAFNNACAPGLSCGAVEKKCYTNPRIENEPCDPVSPCGANLECRDGKCKPPLDCSKCNSYPTMCNYAEDCVKYCKLQPFYMDTCYKDGYISLNKCKELYPNCGYVDPCANCKSFPNWCKEMDHCVKDCKLDPQWAQSCYQYGEITKAKCLELYPQCKDLNPECNACLSYPGLCNSIETCVTKCGLRTIHVQTCKNDGYITLEKCKQLFPGCK